MTRFTPNRWVTDSDHGIQELPWLALVSAGIGTLVRLIFIGLLLCRAADELLGFRTKPAHGMKRNEAIAMR